MSSIVNRSVPRGIDIAAAVLRSQHVAESKIKAWMQRQHERVPQANGGAAAGHAKTATA